MVCQLMPFFMLAKTDFQPDQKNIPIKASQASIPKTPVVAIKVGMVPKPVAKATSQNAVLFTSADLYLAQASLNLLGPRPKIGFSTITLLAIDVVALKDGPISVLDTPKYSGINLLIV